MEMADLFIPDGIIPNLRVTGKKEALAELARRAAELTGQSEQTIFEVLSHRESLGSTGVGQGIGIPLGKLPGLTRHHAFFARLEKSIDFDAIDAQRVDLICLLLAPETVSADHLKTLARISRLLRNRTIRDKLRRANDVNEIYTILAGSKADRAD